MLSSSGKAQQCRVASCAEELHVSQHGVSLFKSLFVIFLIPLVGLLFSFWDFPYPPFPLIFSQLLCLILCWKNRNHETQTPSSSIPGPIDVSRIAPSVPLSSHDFLLPITGQILSPSPFQNVSPVSFPLVCFHHQAQMLQYVFINRLLCRHHSVSLFL